MPKFITTTKIEGLPGYKETVEAGKLVEITDKKEIEILTAAGAIQPYAEPTAPEPAKK